MSLLTTASQTVGPYLQIGFAVLVTDNRRARASRANRFTIEGRLFDGDRQAGERRAGRDLAGQREGRYAHPADTAACSVEPGFRGFGRILTDADGEFRFTTIKPGRVPATGGALQAPHLNVVIFMRGSLRHLVTRLYFPDEPANADDPVLQSVPADRRATLVARAAAGKRRSSGTCFCRATDETVFFDSEARTNKGITIGATNDRIAACPASLPHGRDVRSTRARPFQFARRRSDDVGAADGGLQPRGSACCATTARGHGAIVVAPGPYRIATLARDVVALLDQLAHSARASFCGLSLGGMVGMWLGIHAPERVDGSCWPTPRPRSEPRTCGTRASTSVNSGGMAAISEAVLARWFTRGVHRRASR